MLRTHFRYEPPFIPSHWHQAGKDVIHISLTKKKRKEKRENEEKRSNLLINNKHPTDKTSMIIAHIQQHL